MARETITFSPNTYAGKLYTKWAWPALFAPLGLIDKGLVTPMPGIKKRQVMRTWTGSVELQQPSCTFNAQAGTDTAGEKYLDPIKYEVMKEICWSDFLVSWEVELMKKGSMNDYQPIKSVEDAFLGFMSQKIAIMNEQLYLLGKSGVNAGGIGTATFSAAYPGLLERLRDDSTVIKIQTQFAGGGNLQLSSITIANPGVVTTTTAHGLTTGQRVTISGANGSPYVGGKSIIGQSFIITVLSPTTFSLGIQTTGGAAATAGNVTFVNAANAIAVLTAAYQNTPLAIFRNPDKKVWVSTDIAMGYGLAQAGVASGAGSYYLDDKKMDFLGNGLVEVPYLPNGTVIVADPNNIQLGFDDSGDETNIRTLYLGDTTMDDVVRYKMSMRTDINYIFGNEILLITPLTTTTES